MSERDPGIRILREPIDGTDLELLVEQHFGDMVKFVVDLERHLVAIGGELHADAEEVLLEDGSRQADLWGANYYPGLGPEGCVEYTSLINIRPTRGNPSMEVQDPEVRRRLLALVHELIGRGEEPGWPRSTDP